MGTGGGRLHRPRRLRHVSSIAPGSYGAFGDNWAAQYLSKVDALGGTLALRFKPGFRLMYAGLGFTAKRFPDSFVKQVRNSLNEYDQQILLRPEVATAFGDACAECFAHGSAGLVRDAELLYGRWAFDVAKIERRSTCGRDSTTGSFPIPSTRRWPTRCPARCGIPLTAPGTSWPSARGTTSSPIAAEELGAS